VGNQPNLYEERRLWSQGCRRVAGVDEAGRGAWAGPVVAASVILPPSASDGASAELATLLDPVRDCKLLTGRSRERCYSLILEHALAYGVGFVSAAEIDRIGIVRATRMAMSQAIQALVPPPDYLLIDAVALPQIAIPQTARPKADVDILSVAAASVIAKVTRDRWMVALDKSLGGYGLAQHKGYGTEGHRTALAALGPSAEHRYSYAPIRRLKGADDG